MLFSRLRQIEKIILLLILSMLLAGFILFFTNKVGFEIYVQEDGLAEWLTVAGLLMASCVCLYRFVSLLGKRSWLFLAATVVLGILLFFAAGEEISWGQRILGTKSSAYFVKNNSQQETNIHNLVVNGVKINKLVFSIMLFVVLGFFLLVLPLAYQKNKKIARFADHNGIIIPRLYQVLSFIVLIAATALLPHEKNAELLECGAALLFFLIVLVPKNDQIFKTSA